MVKPRRMFKVRPPGMDLAKVAAEEKEKRKANRHLSLIQNHNLGNDILPYIAESNIKEELDFLASDDKYLPDLIDDVPIQKTKYNEFLEEPLTSDIQKTSRLKEYHYIPEETHTKANARPTKSRKPKHFSEYLGLEDYLDEKTITKNAEKEVMYSHVDSFDTGINDSQDPEWMPTKRNYFHNIEENFSFSKIDTGSMDSDLKFKFKENVLSIEKKKKTKLPNKKTKFSSDDEFSFLEYDKSNFDSALTRAKLFLEENNISNDTESTKNAKLPSQIQIPSPKAKFNSEINDKWDVSGESSSFESDVDDNSNDDEDDFVPYSSNLYGPIDKILGSSKKKRAKTSTEISETNMNHKMSNNDSELDELTENPELSNKKSSITKYENMELDSREFNNNSLTKQLSKKERELQLSYKDYEWDTDDDDSLFYDSDMEKAKNLKKKNKFKMSSKNSSFRTRSPMKSYDSETNGSVEKLPLSKMNKDIMDSNKSELIKKDDEASDDYDFFDSVRESEKKKKKLPSSKEFKLTRKSTISHHDSDCDETVTETRQIKGSVSFPSKRGEWSSYKNFSYNNNDLDYNYSKSLKINKKNKIEYPSNNSNLNMGRGNCIDDSSDLDEELLAEVERIKKNKKLSSKKPNSKLVSSNAVKSDIKNKSGRIEHSDPSNMNIIEPKKKKIKKVPKEIPALQIVERHEWFEGFPLNIKPLQTPVPNVVEDYNTEVERCYTKEQCIERLREIQKRAVEEGKLDLPYSFLIGDDGRVYEGRGWDEMVTDKFNWKGIVIAYIGTFSSEHPPRLQMAQAYNRLIGLGRENKYIRFKYNHSFVNRDGTRALELEL